MFVEKESNKNASSGHMSKIREYMYEYDCSVSSVMQDTTMDDDDKKQSIVLLHDDLIRKVGKMKMSFVTIRRIVETAIGIESNVGVNKEIQNINRKYRKRILNTIYLTNKELFLKCFKTYTQYHQNL